MPDHSIGSTYTPPTIALPPPPLAAPPPDLGLPPGLGPDGILLVLGDRVRDLDGQVGMYQQQINERTNRAKAVQQLLTDLQTMATQAGSQPNGDWNLDDCPGGVTAAYDLIHKIQSEAAAVGIDFSRSIGIENPSDITSDAERGAVRTPWATGPDGAPIGGGVITKETIQGLVGTAQGELSATNSGNEMDMIYLQSAMQARTSQIQLCTNLMADMHQTDQQVIGNIK